MQRICLWVLVGATVTCFWVLFGMLAHPRPDFGHWTIIAVTMPASLFRQHKPVTYYEVMFLNAAIYGLVGLVLEPLFRRHRPAPARPADLPTS
jgi:hypothetical protein